jgi:hypothetical protein
MARTPQTVELPVCPTCGHIGKLPSHFTRKDWCNGPAGSSHKSIRMEKRVFVEVLPTPEAA